MPYRNIIENLTDNIYLDTKHDIISCEWTHDNLQFMIVLKESDKCFIIQHYSSTDFGQLKSVRLEGNYIKCSKVLASKYGNLFVVPYLKDGQFKIYCYDKNHDIGDFNLSEMLDIKEYNRPNDNFPYPMMDCCFLKDNILWANVYRTSSRQMICLKINPLTG